MHIETANELLNTALNYYSACKLYKFHKMLCKHWQMCLFRLYYTELMIDYSPILTCFTIIIVDSLNIYCYQTCELECYNVLHRVNGMYYEYSI